MISGGKILVQALAAHGVKRVFTVAGESYLPVLDALLDYPEIGVVTCRQESGATFMAEAQAQLTGAPAVAFVTRGPGACNAAIGIHAARQSSTPVIMFVGLISIGDRDKEAFQEFDLPQMFGSLTKWSAVIDRAERISDYVTRAFHVARSGRPGPVVLGLPEDILFGTAEETAPKVINAAPVKPSGQDIAALTKMLASARRPLVLVGDNNWTDRACEDLASFSSASHLPAVCAFRRHDIFNHGHGNYIGELGTGPNPALVERVKQADVILCLGARLDEITTQIYTIPRRDQKLIHVYPSAEIFGQSMVPDLAIVSDMVPLAAMLAAGHEIDGRPWAGWRDEGRKEYLAWSDLSSAEPQGWCGADMTHVFRQLRDLLPADAVITTDAGNFSGWCQRYLRHGRPGRLLAPVCGGMGYGVPSAIAASLEYPERIVAGFCGDGGFMMTGHELATAMHHGARPIIIICNNNMYGTIRMHQERDYPGRVSGTALTNPDFAQLAASYGAFSAAVDDSRDFTYVWTKAVASKNLAVIEIRMDPRQMTTRSVL